MKRKLKKLAVLASGNGTTLQAIIDAIDDMKLILLFLITKMPMRWKEQKKLI